MLSSFRIVSFIEGLSYLVLLFIAMPIKYIGENPYPVKIVGMTHGVLFIVFAIALFFAMNRLNWNKVFGFQLLFIHLFHLELF